MVNAVDVESLEIAIIGMAGRFPGAANLPEFWHNLSNGVESITRFADAALAAAGVPEADRDQANYVKARAILETIEDFDAAFFGFTPREAEITDPQHRLFLECAWEALENAGYDAATYTGRIGTYAGSGWSSYLFHHLYANPNVRKSLGDYQTLLGSHQDFLTTRVSYKLNLKGPSIDVQTACSTSLVAVQLAYQSLLTYQCDMALAGGISIYTPQQTGYLYQDEGIFSPDGHCRAFDAQAQGTVSGNGCGIVILKRLQEALADGDTIHAVIKGAAINNDGSLKIGYTAPSVEGQKEVILEAIALAGIHPDTIQYIEAHGTGTPLGDPIELAALTQAFQTETQRQGYCAIGSVKTNIGHLDAAAGIAGLIKTVLALQHQQLPPSLHFHSPNPQIDFAHSPFYVNTHLQPWPQQETPRRAGVSSFGIGGTNAHVILEEAPVVVPSSPSRPWQLLVLSAQTATALETATTNLAEHLQQHPEANLADVAYTLQVGRKRFDHRRILVCQDTDDALKALTAPDADRHLSRTATTSSPPLYWLFPGQGSQHIAMAQELYQCESIFRAHLDRCCELLRPHLGLDLRQLLYPPAAKIAAAADPLTPTHLAQPALFAVEYALAQLWLFWGLRPAAMLGHSIGEYVAACLAGVFSLEDALKLVAARGRLMQQCPPGGMLSVSLAAEAVQAFLSDDVWLAASNAPELCVVSGTLDSLQAFQQTLTDKGVECRLLKTSHAFHSPLMAAALEPFLAQVRAVSPQPPQWPIVSSVTGQRLTDAEATDPHYWVAQLRQPVRFSEGAAHLLASEAIPILLEVGPGKTLSTLVRQQPAGKEAVVLQSMRHPQAAESDRALLLQTLGQLWLAGVTVDWQGFSAHERRRRLSLPIYPFERQRYWIEPSGSAEMDTHASALSKASDITQWFYRPGWKQVAPLKPLFEAEPTPSQSWLIFVDDGVGVQIAQQLQQSGQSVTTVAIAPQFEQRGDRQYALNPDFPEDYNRLLQTLPQPPARIVHCWRPTSGNPSLSSPESQTRGFYSLIFLAQALDRHSRATDVQIDVITHDLYDITGTERLCPAQSMILAPCRVLPQEYPQLTCRNLDVGWSTDSRAVTRLVEQLVSELRAPITEPTVAYRDRHRWLPTFDPVPLAAVGPNTVLKAGGVYLLAGDLVDGLGLVWAEFLAQKAATKLILMGTVGVPAQSEWPTWLSTHDVSDAVSQRIARLQALEKNGATLLTLQADVTDLEQMQAALTQAETQLGPIQGVLYSTALGTDRLAVPVQDLDRETCDRQFQTKIQGLLVLEALLQERQLECCLLQSSLSSIVGGLGFAAYTAANLFIDAFATQRSRTSTLPWLSVNWDACQIEDTALQTTGIGAALAELAMLPEEIGEVSDRLLAHQPLPQIVITPTDLARRIEQSRQSTPKTSAAAAEPSALDTHARPNLPTPYVAPRNAVEQGVAQVWQEFLGVEPIGIHDNFFELGGHSLLAVQAISQLRQRFQVELPMRELLFDSPTIAGIAQVIAANQPTSQDVAELEALLAQVENLSPEEIEAQLADGG